MIKFQYYTFPQYKSNFEVFIEAYQLVAIVYGQHKRVVLKDENPDGMKTCRFCRRKAGEVKFSNDSHFIPQFLGNRYVLFENECDSCNAVFSLYETHFSSYLGIITTITQIKGKKNKVPQFKDAHRKITAKTEDILGVSGVMVTDQQPSGFDINLETGKVVIPYRKPGYIPVKVFKCLLKMAMSLMPIHHLNDYQNLLATLLYDKNDHLLKTVSSVMECWLPIRVEEPRVMLFEKRDAKNRQITHFFKLYFHHKLFQFAVPLCLQDSWLNNNEVITQLACPPLFHHEVEGHVLIAETKDLSGTEKVSEEEAIHFQMDPSHLKQLTAYDPVSKTYKLADFKPEEIVKILFVSRDQQIKVNNKEI